MTSSHIGLDGGDSVFGVIGENNISSSLLESLVVEHKSFQAVASHDNQVPAQVHFPLAYVTGFGKALRIRDFFRN